MVLSPPRGGDMSEFNPDFSAYDVVVLEYNGDDWVKAVQESSESYMENGGGMVYGHAVNHTFPDWGAFNEMIGIGGWGGRNEKHGPFVHYRDGKLFLDHRPCHAGECIDAHEFPARYEVFAPSGITRTHGRSSSPSELDALSGEWMLYCGVKGPKCKNDT